MSFLDKYSYTIYNLFTILEGYSPIFYKIV